MNLAFNQVNNSPVQFKNQIEGTTSSPSSFPLIPNTILGIDIGGTKIASGAVFYSATYTNTITAYTDESISAPDFIELDTIPTQADAGGTHVLTRLCTLVNKLLKNWNCDPRTQTLPFPMGIAIASAGVVDTVHTRILSATELMPGWAGQDLAMGLSKVTDLPVKALNDVQAHGLGEAVYGAGVGQLRVLSIGVGTGLGGAIVISGKPLLGAHQAAGHIGHIVHPLAVGRLCSCGSQLGHIESISSGTGMVEYYLSGRSPSDPIISNGKELSALVAAGNKWAKTVLQDCGRALGECMAGVAHTVDPDIVVFSGSVVQAGADWWAAVSEGFQAEALPVFQNTLLVQGKLGGSAPILGASHFFFQQKGF